MKATLTLAVAIGSILNTILQAQMPDLQQFAASIKDNGAKLYTYRAVKGLHKWKQSAQ